ncbi:MAG: hypothetical protein J6B77_08335, partial [Clostridia bacterium]|nr:hypothetical protein [Clostridia bacterium]
GERYAFDTSFVTLRVTPSPAGEGYKARENLKFFPLWGGKEFARTQASLREEVDFAKQKTEGARVTIGCKNRSGTHSPSVAFGASASACGLHPRGSLPRSVKILRISALPNGKF